MAHFYGLLDGARGQATRCGTKASGMEAIAASWKGAVKTTLYHAEDGTDCARVELIRWQGVGTAALLYDGPVGGEAA